MYKNDVSVFQKTVILFVIDLIDNGQVGNLAKASFGIKLFPFQYSCMKKNL